MALLGILESKSAPGNLEACAQQLRKHPRADHAHAEFGLVVLTAARLIDQGHYVLGSIRIVRSKPLTKQILDFMREPQQDISGTRGTRNLRGLQDLLHFMVSERRNDPVSYTHLTLPTIYSV